ncbi:MAG: ANTAR domain-containing response regulator, partial [Ruminococcus sp.]
MKKAIVVSKQSNNAKALQSLLTEEGFDDVLVLENSSDAKEVVALDEYDLIVINTPLENETGLELAAFCGEKTTSSIMVIVREEKAIEVAQMMTSRGIMVISKPINKHLFHHYLMFSECFKKRMNRVVKENTKLKSQVETMKLVNRAKLLL